VVLNPFFPFLHDFFTERFLEKESPHAQKNVSPILIVQKQTLI